MMEANPAVLATFAAYLVLMLAIGFWAYQRTADSSGYFLGGRSLGPWPAALSAGASDMSGWLLLGLPGFAFTSGIESLWSDKDGQPLTLLRLPDKAGFQNHRATPSAP